MAAEPVVPSVPPAEDGAEVTDALRNIEEQYDLDREELGHGHYGVVRGATKKDTGERFAVKSIPKSKVSNLRSLKREISILRSLDHPNIIKLYDVFETRRDLHLVTELCTGGELFDRIVARGSFTEGDAAELMKKVFQAVAYCHERSIAHRDLKPENFLFTSEGDDADLKVIDFGLSRIYRSDEVMTTKVGTPYYVAPEVLMKSYDMKADLWSCGVILYILLCGFPPFFGKTDAQILRRVRRGRYSFAYPQWEAISEGAKSLIRALLVVDPAERMDVSAALEHPWIVSGGPPDPAELYGVIFESLQRFSADVRLKKQALAVIATTLTEEEIMDLKQAFLEMDLDRNGVITVEELRAGTSKLGKPLLDEELRRILAGVDLDRDGTIDYQEFLAGTMQRNLYAREERMFEAFRHFDPEETGFITTESLVKVLGDDAVRAEAIMSEVDKNRDGKIDYEEFASMMVHDSEERMLEEAREKEEKILSLAAKPSVSGGSIAAAAASAAGPAVIDE